MSARGFGVAAAGVVAGFASLVVLAYVEVLTVPWLIEHVVFGGDPSAGLGVGFLVVAVAFVLIPADVGVAVLVGVFVGMALGRPR